jgi:hypothetical protein
MSVISRHDFAEIPRLAQRYAERSAQKLSVLNERPLPVSKWLNSWRVQ